jgi:hypothetical protein
VTEPLPTSFIDARPLLSALERITEAGRKRKVEEGIDDAAVQYARLAALALDWRTADEAQDIEEAQRLLDKIERMKL